MSVFSKFTWYLVWRKIFAQKSLVSRFSILFGFASIASLLDIIFLFQDLAFIFKIILFIVTIGTVLGAMYAFPLFSIPLGAALVHEAAYSIEESNSTNAVSRLSGAYYGSLSFMASLGQAFASIMLGIILTGPNESNPIIITSCISSMGIFYLISLLFVRHIKLS